MVLPPLRLHDVRGERKALWGNAPMCRRRGEPEVEFQDSGFKIQDSFL